VIARDRVIEKSLQSVSHQVEECGYAIIPDVLSSEEVKRLASDLQSQQLPRSRAGVRHMLSVPCVAQIAHDLRLLGLAQKILGRDAFPFRTTLFDKAPDSNWLITWHQDTALPLMQKLETPGWGPWSVKQNVTYAHAPAVSLEQVIALRLHLDDSTEENGPLRIVPGSHRHGVFSDQQVEAAVASADTVTCIVPQGGAILMRPLIIHASSKSRSSAPRRVLHVEYATRTAVPAPLELAIA
jgi:ectoine hydroxylase-related dioxygenase (phytanoyl-CoA dioxygenase family)